MFALLVSSLGQPAQPASQLLSLTHKLEARAPDLAKALARRRDPRPPSNQRPLVFFHLRKSGGSQVRDALRDATRAHNLSSFIPCYDRVPCESYAPPRQMIHNRTATGSPRYAILAGYHVDESDHCMAGPARTRRRVGRGCLECSGGEPGAWGELWRRPRGGWPRPEPAGLGDPAGPGPAPACARACQAGHLQYSGVEKWMWASSKLRGARVAQTALTQLGKTSRREDGKPRAGMAAQAPPRHRCKELTLRPQSKLSGCICAVAGCRSRSRSGAGAAEGAPAAVPRRVRGGQD